MSWAEVDATIRRAIGGDEEAITWIIEAARDPDQMSPLVLTMAALLGRSQNELDRALSVATRRRDRQVVEIARAHLGGRHALVDALARDHLVDHPDSLIVAWLAGAAGSSSGHGA